ncbi:uncharacterized protein ntf4 [Centroberyx gerrardi]|uniref:uncharacterized protein n=1 Tax=Centroberyx gerrardi TaxID=166262 RepID=UPI003AACA128
MHWLPLVAMVIASALPFPHSPVSRIVAATTEPGLDDRREDRHDSARRLAAPIRSPVDYDFQRNASQKDYNTAAARSRDANGQNHRNYEDYAKSSVHEGLSAHKGKNRGSYQSNSNSDSDNISNVSLDVPTEGGKLRTSGVNSRNGFVSQDNSLPQDYKADSSRRDDTNVADFAKKDNLLDSIEKSRTERNDIRPLQVSGADTRNQAASVQGQTGPEPTVPSEQPGNVAAMGRGGRGTPGAGRGPEPAEESLGLEAGLGLGIRLDGIQEGDEMFLDAHPRVLFSPSPSPPKHPPLLLMLETGMLPEDGDGEQQEQEDLVDVDGHIEGHGDRAIDRSGPLSWAEAIRGAGEVARPAKRNKRSHLSETRRGERSVCESESFWVIDKKTATDSHGQTVTILQDIQTQTGPLKQYFYETRCRRAEQRDAVAPRRSRDASGAAGSTGPGVAGAGCLGVDKKQWVSECKAKQSFVRALTRDDNNRTGWRWIRIDSSCVCVLLSRANRQWGGKA